MICETYNKINDVGQYILDGEVYENHVCSVTLHDLVFELFILILTIILISWWLIPLRIIAKPLKKINFSCKKGD